MPGGTSPAPDETLMQATRARGGWHLGHDLARSPRSYGVKETRAIVGALLGMVHDPDDADDAGVAS